MISKWLFNRCIKYQTKQQSSQTDWIKENRIIEENKLVYQWFELRYSLLWCRAALHYSAMSFGRAYFVSKSVRIYPIKFALFLLCVVLLCSIFFFDALRHSNGIVEAHDEEQVENIIKLSNRYISKLTQGELGFQNASETESFKTSLISYLSNMKQRVEELEKKVQILESELHYKVVAKAAISKCTIPSFEGYSSCQGKLEWMRAKWNSDSCYAEWGVDGSDCSIIHYLSEVEHWCPKVQLNSSLSSPPPMPQKKFDQLFFQNDFSALYAKLNSNSYFDWIKGRITRMEKSWLDGAKKLSSKLDISMWKKKKILLHLGLLSDDSGWKIAKNAFSGGPLGEMVQWADIISSLFVLGHDITLTISKEDLSNIVMPNLRSIKSSNCPLRNDQKLFDVIFTDIYGLKMFKKVTPDKFHLIQCNIRVVDSFGTEPEYNNPGYAVRHGKNSEWGKLDFMPKQFNTMFPHTPDNTFLGFVIEQINNVTSENDKQSIALVYGKKDEFWQGRSEYLNAIHEVLPIHGTVDEKEGLHHVPPFVENHGVLPGEDLHKLLHAAKIFVGMGFPYEGPAPLEAIASGAVFLNPVIVKDSPLYKKANEFYMKKPTTRRLSSQHPYAETYIGHPHVRMVHMHDIDAVKEIAKEILDGPSVTPYMPEEFTNFGMLERVAYLLEKQDFCSEPTFDWPPLSSLQVLVSEKESSCVDACTKQGLICEPNFFPYINKKSIFQELNIKCDTHSVPSGDDEQTDYPSVDGKKCYMQNNNKLFSCAGQHTNTHRICPCRDYIKGRVAFCKNCFVT
ncbi:unnamed protein product [Clavelina lepadiformis]|uniref:alpha-1,6-mannosyl-glycoprotein 6-beta-N-acetylglucosaminyltransferase n=2 Tax=Clavelina lepadiformis TaxID=159417 RepID=A0ABP0GDN4_CLALP